MTSPLQVLALWLRGIFAVCLIGLGAWSLWEWYERSLEPVYLARPSPEAGAAPVELRFEPEIGWNVPTAFLAGAAAVSLWSLGGGLLLARLPRRREPAHAGGRFDHRRVGQRRRIPRADGTGLHVEIDGDPAGRPVVFIHGWGGDGREWNPLRDALRADNKLILLDLPGLGSSEQPADRQLSLPRMAADLRAVLDAEAGERRAVLVGHSIGGMVILTFYKLYPELARRQIAGVVLAHTSYTNPLRTMALARLWTALQRPLVEPLMRLTILFSPLVRAMTWLSYLNGSVHRSHHRSGFSGRESREQLDFTARFVLRASPAVLARGCLGMFRYDASDVLERTDVPALVVVGGRDRTTKPEAGDHMRRTLPQAEELTFADAKHYGPIEYAAEFARRVREFVDQRSGSGGLAPL